MSDENEDLQNGREEDSDSGRREEEEKKEKKRRRRILFLMLLLILLLLLLLFLRSCRARDEPLPDGRRIYEENRGRDTGGGASAEDKKRLNIAVAESYRISKSNPCFYIGFPKENVYDAVFTLKDAAGKELYRTNYVAAGTHVAIDGTSFLEKGDQKIDCVVSVYERDTGELISDCTSVVLNISYQ